MLTSHWIDSNPGANVRHTTGVTQWPSRFADTAAMVNHPMRIKNPLFLGQATHEIMLSADGIVFSSQSQPTTDSAYMGIDDHSSSQAISSAQDHIGRLAADSR